MILEGRVQRQIPSWEGVWTMWEGRSVDGVGEAPPSSSPRTVQGKLLELEGNSQHSWSELLPTPQPPGWSLLCSFW